MLFQIIISVLIGFGAGAIITHFYYTSSSLAPTESQATNSGIGDFKVIKVQVSEQDLEDILTKVESWEKNRLERFLANFLREREIDILEALAKAFMVDGKPKHTYLENKSKGWMNRHQIHLESGVSRKVIYKRAGVMDRLTTVGLIRMAKKGTWGRGKYEYRLNTNNGFVYAYAKAVLRASS